MSRARRAHTTPRATFTTSVKEPVMRLAKLCHVVVVSMLVLSPFAGSGQSDSEWKSVEQALGKPGQMMPDDVFRIAMPRSDLKVKVQGVDVKAGFALGSYATFKKMAHGTMMMGDLVLLDEEVNGVMSG